MDIGLQLFQLFFVGDAKMLLFINNQQTKIAEPDVFGKQRMRADDNLYRTFLQPLFGQSGFFGSYQSGKHFNPYGKTLHPFFEIVIMLTGQQGGGDNQRNLRAGRCHRKGRSQGNLGFAETDIAAHQSVHRNSCI